MHRRLFAALAVALTALFAVPGIAAAEGALPTVGLQITSVNLATRQLTAVLHCVPADKAGREIRFVVGSSVADDALAALQPGQFSGARVVVNNPPVVVALAPMPCDPQAGPAPKPQPGDQPEPGDQPQPPSDDPQQGDDPTQQQDDPADGTVFERGFLSRVWKFVAEVDGYDAGELSVTIDKVLNLPKKWADQDDDLVDQDAIVLVKRGVKVTQDGARVRRSALEDAEHVRVHGKLLAEDDWTEDDEGDPVPTIRAKKIVIVD